MLRACRAILGGEAVQGAGPRELRGGALGTRMREQSAGEVLVQESEKDIAGVALAFQECPVAPHGLGTLLPGRTGAVAAGEPGQKAPGSFRPGQAKSEAAGGRVEADVLAGEAGGEPSHTLAR
jgi:hypothetical protein